MDNVLALWPPYDILSVVGLSNMGMDIGDLVRQHRPALLRCALRVLHDTHEAEDAVQTALTRALTAMDSGTEPDNLRAWLFKIVFHEACRIRSGKKHQGPLSEDVPQPLSRDASGEMAALHHRILVELRDLSDIYRKIILLRFGQHLSYEDTAKALDLPVGTVKSYQARALQAVRERLGNCIEQEEEKT